MARLRVEVVYALAGRQEVVVLQLPEGANAGQAASASGLGVPGSGLRLGIGGREVPPAQLLREGDRVEFLRPLAFDPKEARRRRAKRKR